MKRHWDKSGVGNRFHVVNNYKKGDRLDIITEKELARKTKIKEIIK